MSLQKSITNGESNTYTHTEGDSIGCNVNVGGGIGAPMGDPLVLLVLELHITLINLIVLQNQLLLIKWKDNRFL